MKAYRFFLYCLALVLPALQSCAAPMPAAPPQLSASAVPARTDSLPERADSLQTGAAQTGRYLPLLQGKRVGMVVNPTAVIGNSTTVDSLLKLGVNIVRIFGPEHGFRGNASAGIAVSNDTDPETGISVVSLYGKHETPTATELSDIDLMVFDIQDVGVRFYTYINTLQHVMEACAAAGKPLLILDRPNPNGFYVDGPVLDPRLVSGIGLQAIPVVHGLTVGEYAQMLNGEGWLKNRLKCNISVITVSNYTHDTPYTLPVKPSPNLNTPQAVLLYPALCLFEGTYISQGRGTLYPFTVLGAPALKGKYAFSFRPESIPGMAETPLHQHRDCYGLDLRNADISNIRKEKALNIKWLIELYKAYPDQADFFNNKLSKQMGNFDRLAGVYTLKAQLIAGKSEKEIRESWQPALDHYKSIRRKYLLYP